MRAYAAGNQPQSRKPKKMPFNAQTPAAAVMRASRQPVWRTRCLQQNKQNSQNQHVMPLPAHLSCSSNQLSSKKTSQMLLQKVYTYAIRGSSNVNLFKKTSEETTTATQRHRRWYWRAQQHECRKRCRPERREVSNRMHSMLPGSIQERTANRGQACVTTPSATTTPRHGVFVCLPCQEIGKKMRRPEIAREGGGGNGESKVRKKCRVG